jgi:hypothetical protein
MHSREIHSEAFDWVVKLERGLNPDEQSLLDCWLALDTRCVGALARAQAYRVYAEGIKKFSDAQKLQLHANASEYSSHQ